jgi:hypothetical protein
MSGNGSPHFLNILQMAIQFNDPNQFEVDSNDLQDLLQELNIECLNILAIAKNNFFILLKGIEDVRLCFQKLNNLFIEKLQARIEVNLCVLSPESSFARPTSSYRSIFEIEAPKIDSFDIRRRIFGLEGYNVQRVLGLCEKEFFEGTLTIEDMGVEEEHMGECWLIRQTEESFQRTPSGC